MALPSHQRRAAGFDDGFVAACLAPWLTNLGTTRIHGLAGLQGSGKSTLAAQAASIARSRGVRVVTLSLDDFYLGRRERQVLARTVHPLLATRGPPGSHDLALACATLDALRKGEAVRVPRFDKLADTRRPPSRWPVVNSGLDLVIFEGWCLKVPPQSQAALQTPLNALESEGDRDGGWRHYCNEALRSYAPLWKRLDSLTFLQPPGFEVVTGWRWQQERALQRARPGRAAMSRADVGRFVQHFERVSRQALRTLPAIADRVLALDEHRRPPPG